MDESQLRGWLAELDHAARQEIKTGAPVDANWWRGQKREFDYAREVGQFGSCSTVAIGLRWLKRAAGQGELCIGQKVDKTYKPDPKHPALQLLRRPNPWQSSSVFFDGTYDSLVLAGEAFWVKIRPLMGGSPVELYWVPNHLMEVYEDPRGVRPIYKYRYLHPAQPRWLETWDVCHLKYEADRDRWWRGTSPLKEQIKNMAGITMAERWTASVLRRGHGGTAFIPKERMLTSYDVESPDEKALRRTEARLTEDFSGNNAGGIAIPLVPGEFQKIGYSPEEMAINNMLDRPEAYTLAAIGTNAHVCGLPGSAATQTYENTGQYYTQAWENGVIPLQDRVAEDGVQHQLLYGVDERGVARPEWDGDPEDIESWWDRSEVPALREDVKSKTERVQILWTSDLMTRNAALEATDQEPLPANDPRGQMFYSEWMRASSTTPDPDDSTDGSGNTPPDDTEEEGDEEGLREAA